MPAIRHKLEYTASNVPLELVIDSLKGQLRLLNEAVEVLQATSPGANLRITGVTVNKIQSGSLLIDLALQIYGTYQSQIDGRVINGVESLLGVDVPQEYEALVTLILIGLTYYMSRMIYDAVREKKKDKSTPSVHIQGDYNNVVNIIANKLVISPQDVERAFEEVVHPTKFRQLVKPVADFLRPAKREPGSKIDGRDAEITSEAIKEFPNDADIGQLAQTEIVNLPDALIDIRALDKDRSKTGWAAKVLSSPDFQDKRLPMDLYPTVDSVALAEHAQVRADLAIEMLRNTKGELIPKRLHLLAYKEVEE